MKIILLSLLIALPMFVAAQCSPDEYIPECKNHLPEGYVYLKHFPLKAMEGDSAWIDFSYVLRDDFTYVVSLCSEGSKHKAQGLVLRVFDSDHKQVASNIKNGVFQSSVGLKPEEKERYHFTLSSRKGYAHCGAAIISAKLIE